MFIKNKITNPLAKGEVYQDFVDIRKQNRSTQRRWVVLDV